MATSDGSPSQRVMLTAQDGSLPTERAVPASASSVARACACVRRRARRAPTRGRCGEHGFSERDGERSNVSDELLQGCDRHVPAPQRDAGRRQLLGRARGKWPSRGRYCLLFYRRGRRG